MRRKPTMNTKVHLPAHAASTTFQTTSASDPTHMSATELVRQITNGDLSASEAVETHIAQIERVNSSLNAVVVKRYEAARSEARNADARRKAGEPLGALFGLPVTIKES